MGRGKRAYETNGEGGTVQGESIQNVNKEYRKKRMSLAKTSATFRQ